MSKRAKDNGKDPVRVVTGVISSYGGAVFDNAAKDWVVDFACGANCGCCARRLKEKGFTIQRESYSNQMVVKGVRA